MANGDDDDIGLPGESADTPAKPAREADPSKAPLESARNKPKDDPPSASSDDKQDYGAYAMQKQLDALQKAQEDQRKMEEETLPQYKALRDQYAWNMANRPQMPQMPQTQPLPVEDRRALGQAVWGYAAIALPLAALFGARGGAFATAAMGGFGQGLTALMQGRQQEYENAFNRANAINQQQGISYNRQMNAYKEILNSQNLTTDDMMHSVEMVSKMYGNKLLADKAEVKDWNGVVTQIQKMQDAQKKGRDNYIRNRNSTVTSNYKDYAAVFAQKHGFWPDPSHYEMSQEQLDIMAKDSFAKWLKEHPKGKGAQPTLEDQIDAAIQAQLPDFAPVTGEDTDKESGGEESAGEPAPITGADTGSGGD